MHDRDPNTSARAGASPGDELETSAGVIEPRSTGVVGGRWRIWAPIAMRAAALGIALVGLAGIGAVVSHAAPPASPSLSHAGFELGALSDRTLAALGAGGSGFAQASVVAPSLSPPSLAPTSAPPANPPAPDPPPCPHTPSGADSSAPAGAPPPSHERRPQGARAAADERPVALNAADAAELRRLPGVGAKRAEAILALRQRLGRFRRPSDLLRVKGIGPRTLERMLPHLVLD